MCKKRRDSENEMVCSHADALCMGALFFQLSALLKPAPSASLASSAFCRVMDEICSKAPDVSSMEAAGSDAPAAN